MVRSVNVWLPLFSYQATPNVEMLGRHVKMSMSPSRSTSAAVTALATETVPIERRVKTRLPVCSCQFNELVPEETKSISPSPSMSTAYTDCTPLPPVEDVTSVERVNVWLPLL